MNQALLYSKYNGLQRADAQYVLDNYFRLIKWRCDGTERVLDIGCGAGDVTTRMLLPRLPAAFANLVGADLSAEMVEFAQTKWCAGPTSDGRVAFHRLDILADGGRPDWALTFDHIVSFYCLHWIQDQRKALHNMSAMLKPGGDILLTFLASNPIFHIYENLARNDKWATYMANTHKYISPLQYSNAPDVEFERLLRDAGFTVHLCKVVERQYVYSDLTVLRKSVIAVSPFIANIPDNLQNDYLADFIEEVRDLKYIDYNSNNNEERVSVPYRLLVVFARKPM